MCSQGPLFPQPFCLVGSCCTKESGSHGSLWGGRYVGGTPFLRLRNGLFCWCTRKIYRQKMKLVGYCQKDHERSFFLHGFTAILLKKNTVANPTISFWRWRSSCFKTEYVLIVGFTLFSDSCCTVLSEDQCITCIELPLSNQTRMISRQFRNIHEASWNLLQSSTSAAHILFAFPFANKFFWGGGAILCVLPMCLGWFWPFLSLFCCIFKDFFYQRSASDQVPIAYSFGIGELESQPTQRLSGKATGGVGFYAKSTKATGMNEKLFFLVIEIIPNLCKSTEFSTWSSENGWELLRFRRRAVVIRGVSPTRHRHGAHCQPWVFQKQWIMPSLFERGWVEHQPH